MDKEYNQDPETPLMVHHDNMHNYLEMKINSNTKEKVVFIMFDQIQDSLGESPEESYGQAETQAASHLLDVYKEREKLNKQDGSLFLHLIAKLLYLSKSARPYIQTYVSFMFTRVRDLDIEY